MRRSLELRKKWKRSALIAILATSVALGGCVSGGGQNNGANPGESGSQEVSGNSVNKEGFPIVQEPITLKMFTRIAPVNGPFKDMPVFQDYEKMSEHPR